MNLETLDLSDNFLPTISEEIEKPLEVIKYLLKYQMSQKRPMNEVKVLVLGDEKAFNKK